MSPAATRRLQLGRLGRRSASGFSLLELMVSLTVGGIAITSIYAIGSSATRQFHQQQQIASAQTSVRLALNQIKRDLARAGFLSTPNAGLAGQACGTVLNALHAPPNNTLAAVTRFDNNVTIGVGNLNNNVDPNGLNDDIGTSVDEITLVGNYETASEYAGIRVSNATNNEIAISANWYAFQRDFHDWYNPEDAPFDAPSFGRAFAAGRLIRIRTTSGLSHFATIDANGVTAPTTGGTPEDTKVRFTPAVPDGCSALVNGGWVAPVSVLRYYVQNAVANTLAAQRNVGHGPIAQLLRQEVQPANKLTPLVVDAAGNTNTRVIADYVVGFNLAFVMTAATGDGLPDSYDNGAVQSNPNMTSDNAFTTVDDITVNAAPERVRAVMIDLAVRTPEQDKTFPWSTDCMNLRCYKAIETAPGAARVRRMRAEVFLPNVAAEGY